ncbi:hypothetical protein DRB07_12970 [Actinomyces sp. Z3]|nr:hypothetical protein DRB07_12970 [Actinomyces sp. Z3]
MSGWWVWVEVPDNWWLLDTTDHRDLDITEATFTAPDLASFLELDALGLTVTGQRITPDEALVECRLQAQGLGKVVGWMVGC